MAGDAVAGVLGATHPGGTGLRAHQYGGYRPVACDLVGFFRPRLRDRATKHYSSAAGRVARHLGASRHALDGRDAALAVLCLLVRGESTDTSETDLQMRLLQQANEQLADDEALVRSRVSPPTAPGGGDSTLCVRAPVNFTARRAALSRIQGRGVNPRGALVRPLPRTYKGSYYYCDATRPPRDPQLGTGPTSLWLRTQIFWDDLICSNAQPGAPTFSTALIHDPRFDEPLLLNTALPLTGAHLQAF